jgi:hypothetical protein
MSEAAPALNQSGLKDRGGGSTVMKAFTAAAAHPLTPKLFPLSSSALHYRKAL